MKAPTMPAVEERRPESKHVFFRPDDDGKEDDDKDDDKEDGDGHEDDDGEKDDDDDNLFCRPASHNQSFQS